MRHVDGIDRISTCGGDVDGSPTADDSTAYPERWIVESGDCDRVWAGGGLDDIGHTCGNGCGRGTAGYCSNEIGAEFDLSGHCRFGFVDHGCASNDVSAGQMAARYVQFADCTCYLRILDSQRGDRVAESNVT